MGEDCLTSEILPSVHTLGVSSPTTSPPSTATVNQVAVLGDQFVMSNQQADETVWGYITRLGAGVKVICVGESPATDWETTGGIRPAIASEFALNCSDYPKSPNCIVQVYTPSHHKNLCFFSPRPQVEWEPSSVSEVVKVTPLTVDVEATFDAPPVRECQTEEMLRNLSSLAALAKKVLPELREMQPEEKKNLQQYYKKRYRKV